MKALILSILFFVNVNLGLEFNKQQNHNPNTDFLLHETGGNPTAAKTNNVGSKSPSLTFSNSHSSLSSGKQNYVDNFPPLNPSSSINPQVNVNPSTSETSRNPQTSSGKRDYVAPQFPSLKPTQQANGKVKDLVNFYDNKGKDQNVPPRMPSYSSILQGSNGQNKPSITATTSPTTKYSTSSTRSTQKASTAYTPKPLSFSSVVAGVNIPKSPSVATTTKPTSSINFPTTGSKSTTTGNNRNNLSTPRPGNSVLPSSIINGNKNNQASPSNNPTDAELQTLSEELLRKDNNNAAKHITVNYQEKTTSQSKEDKAPQPLLTIAADVWNITTVQKFVPLLDNYERDTLVNEYITPKERNEEISFMDAIMSTAVIRHLMNFLKDKGYVTPDPKQQRDYLKQLWFSLYSRGKGKISSSGFEHVFVSELKNGEVSGLHNWIYFSKEESANRVNYLGYLKYEQLSDKGVVMKLHFNQQGIDKPVDSMFIGTSPELEIALYTLCFVTRADNQCKLKLGNKDVEIVTHTFRYRSKNLIGSAYPQI